MTGLKEVSVSEILGEALDGPDRKGGGARSLVLSFVRRNFEGVTVEMVSQAADISATRAYRMLKELRQDREIYKRRVPGLKADLYYPNGRLIHKYLQDKRDFGSQIFRVSVHEGRKDPRLQIQERIFTLLDGEKVEGSIYIDLPNATSLVEFINEMLSRFEGYEKSKEIKRR